MRSAAAAVDRRSDRTNAVLSRSSNSRPDRTCGRQGAFVHVQDPRQQPNRTREAAADRHFVIGGDQRFPSARPVFPVHRSPQRLPSNILATGTGGQAGAPSANRRREVSTIMTFLFATRRVFGQSPSGGLEEAPRRRAVLVTKPL